jgi:hypothetical protein
VVLSVPGRVRNVVAQETQNFFLRHFTGLQRLTGRGFIEIQTDKIVSTQFFRVDFERSAAIVNGFRYDVPFSFRAPFGNSFGDGIDEGTYHGVSKGESSTRV